MKWAASDSRRRFAGALSKVFGVAHPSHRGGVAQSYHISLQHRCHKSVTATTECVPVARG